MSPVVLRVGRYRFSFFSADRPEPPHVHVYSGDGIAKFWLAPVAPAWSNDYDERELRRIGRLISEHREQLLEGWREFFRNA